jgi:hypothetical protein
LTFDLSVEGGGFPPIAGFSQELGPILWQGENRIVALDPDGGCDQIE